MEELKSNKVFVGLNVFSSVIMSFMMALTGPTLQIYFMSQVSTQLLAFVNMLAVGIAVVSNGSANSKKMLRLYHQYFPLVVIVDVLAFIAVSTIGEYHIEVRFIGMAVITAVSTAIWSIVMNNVLNNIWAGDERTRLSANLKTAALIGSFIGGGILIMLPEGGIGVHNCIIFQCVCMTIDGIANYIIHRMYEKAKVNEPAKVEE